jgi:hypothetical protein
MMYKIILILKTLMKVHIRVMNNAIFFIFIKKRNNNCEKTQKLH